VLRARGGTTSTGESPHFRWAGPTLSLSQVRRPAETLLLLGPWCRTGVGERSGPGQGGRATRRVKRAGDAAADGLIDIGEAVIRRIATSGDRPSLTLLPPEGGGFSDYACVNHHYVSVRRRCPRLPSAGKQPAKEVCTYSRHPTRFTLAGSWASNRIRSSCHGADRAGARQQRHFQPVSAARRFYETPAISLLAAGFLHPLR
jgi:hypothetical protein